MQTDHNRTQSRHHVIEERTSMTTRELYEMCEDAWQRGYDAANREQDMEHNQSVKKYRIFSKE